jgi:hypothetical protein
VHVYSVFCFFVFFFQGINGVTLNHTLLPPNQQMPIHDMDTVEFGNASKYVYVFLAPSELRSEEQTAKRKRDTSAIPNYAPLEDSSVPIEQVVSGEQKTHNFFRTLKDKELHEDLENDKIQLNLYLARIESLELKFAQEEMEKNEFQGKESDEKRICNYFQEYQVLASTRKISNVFISSDLLIYYSRQK